MSTLKRSLSPAPLPPSKRLPGPGPPLRAPPLTFDSALYDELILCIFAHLGWADLCAVQHTNRTWARLAGDNQLWKALYLGEYGRARLRGVRGHIGIGLGRGGGERADGRAVKPLPGRARGDGELEGVKDWKWMFRISSNWRTGRCSVEHLCEPVEQHSESEPSDSSIPSQAHILLAGTLLITASSAPSLRPQIHLRSPSGATHTLLCTPTHTGLPTQITALALDQSPPSSHSHHLRLAAFLATGEFAIFAINHTDPRSSTRALAYLPPARSTRTAPVVQAAYHHPLLATLSRAFVLSLYGVGEGQVVHTQTLTSFTSHPPASLVLSAPSASRSTYKLVLAYAVPVYPAHWSVGATELLIAGPASSASSPDATLTDTATTPPLTVFSTRTARAFDVPHAHGWIDEAKLAAMRAQWGRRVERVAAAATDGKWVVLAPAPGGRASLRSSSPYDRSESVSASSSASSPSSSSSYEGASSPYHAPPHSHSPTHLQLYRLHFPSPPSSLSSLSPPAAKLVFVRTLHGHTGGVGALALADGRCVSLGLGAGGGVWVWDLEGGTGAEVVAESQSESAGGGAGVFGRGLGGSGAGADTGEDEEGEEGCGRGEGAMGSVVFDERRIVSACGARGVQVRRFDI